MYEALVKSTDLSNGMLTVEVEFTNTDTQEVFTDEFQTNQGQDESWLDTQVKNRLTQLNALPALKDSIAVNTAITLDTPAPVRQSQTRVNNGAQLDDDAQAARDEYVADYATFQQMINALSQGIIASDNADFVALKQKLSDNFSTDYLDIFTS